MKEYQVQIKEVPAMTVTVNAENAAQTREIVEKRYNDCDYYLDAAAFRTKGLGNGALNGRPTPLWKSATVSSTLYQQATCLYSHRHSLSGEIP